jgi:pteridine reductase
MNSNIENRVVLITGAAQRIGAETARLLHSKGFNIIIHYRSSGAAADALCQQLNHQRKNSAACLQADLCSTKAVKELAVTAERVWGRIDALINNASSFYPTAVAEATEDDWQALIDSNLKGPYFLTQALVDSLRKQQGCVINIVDIHSEKPLRDHSIYSIAKAGVAMMTKSLAKELAPDIRVNGVSPGAILWPQQEMPAQQKNAILNKIPLARTGEPNDIARTIAFLIEQAPYISGQIIAVDGGRSLNM